MFNILLQVQIDTDGRQVARQGQHLQCISQVTTNFPLHIVSIGHYTFEILPVAQPLGGGFWSAFFHPGNVVRLVTGQCQKVNDLFRRHTKFLYHAIDIHRCFGHGIDEGDMVIDQLGHILVTGGDYTVNIRSSSTLCQRTDYIIGLDTRHLDQRQAQKPDHFVYRFYLLSEFQRHRWTVGFVLFVHFMTKSRALCIEYHRYVFRFSIFYQAPQHIGNAQQGTRRFTRRIGQVRKCVVCPVDIR